MPSITSKQEELINKLYPKLGGKETANLLDINYNQLRKFCYKNKIKLLPSTKNKIQKENSLKYNHQKTLDEYDVDPRQFFDIQKPEVAYILGLLWADGYIHCRGSIVLQAVLTDIKEIYPIFKKTGNWLLSYKNPPERKPQGIIHKNNIEIYKFLLENDYDSKSTLSADKILTKIPNNLKYYWFRGLIDGDGCFYKNRKHSLSQFSIAGGYKQDWIFVKNLFNKLGVKYSIVRRKQLQHGKLNGSSVIRITNKKDIKTVGDYTYLNFENDKIGLNRKYNKWLSITH